LALRELGWYGVRVLYSFEAGSVFGGNVWPRIIWVVAFALVMVVVAQADQIFRIVAKADINPRRYDVVDEVCRFATLHAVNEVLALSVVRHHGWPRLVLPLIGIVDGMASRLVAKSAGI
jgi:hypothetical protein